MKPKNVNLYEYIYIQIRTLKLIGMWFFIPYSKNSIRFWLSIFSRMVIGVLAFFIPTALQLVYVVKLIFSGNAEIQEVVAIVNLLCTEILVSFKLLDLRLRRSKLTQLMDQLISEPHYFVAVRNGTVARAVKLSRRLFLLLFVSSALDVAVHIFVVPAVNRFQSLPLKMDAIFIDVNQEAFFIYVCVYQIIHRPFFFTAFAALQTMPWASMQYAITQLDILIYNIKNMKRLVQQVQADRKCDEKSALKEILKRFVVHHQDITGFVKLLQSAFSGQLMLTLIMSASILGTTAVQVLSIESPMRHITEILWIALYMTIFTLVLLIDSYFGNTITVKNSELAALVYAYPWTDVSKEVKRNLIIFMSQTQRPLVITAARLVPVSMQTFTKVMNWTYKGFAVMNQMKK